ncbi:septum formation initiator family protein [Gracilibacillus caseinilyticus]|uniref:Septum formation initiator family protein n=1 Tax=Gracilibacillus caseinilyticus TaxID=2932256 RepID=A0ABY4F4W6_9BACI|nr:septum formation initiator family protein [Gracilibacillus caseinilyticus]UOQ49511.1 septum formation initiator family protein [Gracilibacillus caseinilyticus]
MAKRNNVSRINEAYIEQYDAQKKRQIRRKKKLYRRLMLFGAVMAITMIFLTTYHINQRTTYHDMKQEYTDLSDELTTMQTKEKKLQEEIELLNDEEYLLQIAKTNYFFTEEGEIVFKLPEEDPSY